MISALVMAAGQSRRMGTQNKLLLPCKAEPVVRRSVRAVIASRAGEVIVVTGHDHKAVKQALVSLEVEFVENPDYQRGLATSVAAGVRQAASTANAFMVCLADLFLLSAQDIDFLIAAFEAQQRIDPAAIVRPIFGSTPGHPVLWPAMYRSALSEVRGRRPVDRFAQHVFCLPVQSERYVRDIDTRDDLAALDV